MRGRIQLLHVSSCVFCGESVTLTSREAVLARKVGARCNAHRKAHRTRASGWGVNREYAVELLRGGMTLREVGETLGVTRERVRQIAVEAGCNERLGRAAKKAARLEAILSRAPIATCRVCLGPIGFSVKVLARGKPEGRKTCSHECARLWGTLRNHLDPQEKQLHLKRAYRRYERLGRHIAAGTRHPKGDTLKAYPGSRNYELLKRVIQLRSERAAS